jgi:hypothetical protein
MSLSMCNACGGFVPAHQGRCPNCRSSRDRRARSIATRLGMLAGPIGGGAIAMTLMACYGMPPCADGSLGCYGGPDAAHDEQDGGSDAQDGASNTHDASGDARGDVESEDAGSDASTDAPSQLDAAGD